MARLLVVLVTLFYHSFAFAQQSPPTSQADQVGQLPWTLFGTGKIGDQASISVQSGYAFVSGNAARRFIELMGNPGRDNLSIYGPRPLNWFAVFAFEDSGYVKDDEKLNPDELLGILRESNLASQAERKRLGLEQLTLQGWAVPPHYDLVTKRLEWGTRLTDEKQHEVVNYTIKILGRQGVMNAVLVSEPASLEQDIADFKKSLLGYEFDEGKRYSEFRAGDKLAEYGLAALIVGGAAAAAAKGGLFNGLGKLLLVGGLGLLALLAKGFRSIFNRTR